MKQKANLCHLPGLGSTKSVLGPMSEVRKYASLSMLIAKLNLFVDIWTRSNHSCRSSFRGRIQPHSTMGAQCRCFHSLPALCWVRRRSTPSNWSRHYLRHVHQRTPRASGRPMVSFPPIRACHGTDAWSIHSRILNMALGFLVRGAYGKDTRFLMLQIQ